MSKARTFKDMLAFIVLLLVIWAILAILGFVIHGLVWLAFIGIILFVGTVVIGAIRGRSSKN